MIRRLIVAILTAVTTAACQGFSSTPGQMVALGRLSYAMAKLRSGEVLIVGGMDTNGKALATAEIFDPLTGFFRLSKVAMPYARFNCSATLLNDGRVLISGGTDSGGSSLSSALIYDPGADSFIPLASRLSVPRSQHRATLLMDGSVLITGGINAAGGTSAPISSADVFHPITNQFKPVGNMTSARAQHTATLLLDGKVLIAGGMGSKWAPQSSAELYDPVAENFNSTGQLALARFGAAAILLSDGRALITGGQNYVETLQDAELYDSAAGRFTQIAKMPEGHANHAIVLLPGGKVLVAGGLTGLGFPFLRIFPEQSTAIFDPSTNTFRSAAPLNIARAGIDAVVLNDGRVFIPGGANFDSKALADAELYTAGLDGGTVNVSGGLHAERWNHAAIALSNGKILITGGADSTGKVLTSAEVYDPATERLTPTKNTMTAPRYGHTMTRLNSGKILIAGGASNTAELFDPATNEFTAISNKMIAARFHHTATLLKNGLVLLAGGVPTFGGSALQSAELYDPFSNTFVPVAAPMLSPRVRQIAALLPDGNVLLAGGSTDQDTFTGATNTAETYDPSHKAFTLTAGTMNKQRYAATGTVLADGSILIVGGSSSSAILASAEIFNPATRRFSPTAAPLMVPRSAHCAALLADGRVLVIGGYTTIGVLSSTEIYSTNTGAFTLGPSMKYMRRDFTARVCSTEPSWLRAAPTIT